ncbi:hypothetical protein BV22DRAFT_1050774 [Leucogyrophana mollusca]|uniref:Uncharacterized protein n=1 Tax=Leucogyrophana mollusca TaxID=85980 RepID=A0ACB8B2G9_9AGAM|nr:hypothetical protein BV22DRAFT_1050774 [Leucogyrophana mollusca]
MLKPENWDTFKTTKTYRFKLSGHHEYHVWTKNERVVLRGKKRRQWYGLIKEIRVEAKEPQPQIWMLIQWFYSLDDISGPKFVSKDELILSDHYDIVEAETLESPICIFDFQEVSADQNPIPKGFWFVRWFMSVTDKKKAKIHRPYSPDTDIQRFCLGCKKWYDVECIRGREVQLPNEALSPPSTPPNPKICDPVLIQLLSKPVERGKAMGLVGNGKAVINARRIVREAAEGRTTDSEWRMEVMIFLSAVKTDCKGWLDRSFIYYNCPECNEYWL